MSMSMADLKIDYVEYYYVPRRRLPAGTRYSRSERYISDVSRIAIKFSLLSLIHKLYDVEEVACFLPPSEGSFLLLNFEDL